MINIFRRKPNTNAKIEDHNARVAQQRETLRLAIQDENKKQILQEVMFLQKLIRNLDDSLELFPDSPDRDILMNDRKILERHRQRFMEMVHVHIN
jgi:hypothetical protein